MHAGYKTPMLTLEAFMEMWQAIDEDEQRQIAGIKQETQPVREALIVLWRKFNPDSLPPVPRHLLSGLVDSDSASQSLISGIRCVIDNIDQPFTTQDVIRLMDRMMPELRASERRVSISSYLSRLATEEKLIVVLRQPNGLSNTYAKSPRWENQTPPSTVNRTRVFLKERS